MPPKGWKNPVVAERDARALQMRREGYSYDEIIKATGISQARIWLVANQAGDPNRTTADRVVTEETRRKQSEAMRGRQRSADYRANISAAKRGERNGQWRGEEVGYQAAHQWLRKYYGSPAHCENCNGDNAKSDSYTWAYLPGGGGHSRRREDYIRLCRSCHTQYDRYGLDVAANYPLPTL
jgi:hypothetical protein